MAIDSPCTRKNVKFVGKNGAEAYFEQKLNERRYCNKEITIPV
jgi:hypothetical protein